MRYIKYFKDWVRNNFFSIAVFSIALNSSLSFISENSYVRGVLIDYLIPRLYLSQILILILLILFLRVSKRNLKVLLLLVVFLIINVVFSLNPTVSLFYISRRLIFLPFLFLLFSFNTPKINYRFLYVLNFAYLIVLVVQFVSRSSVFGYFPFGFYPFEGVGVRLDYLSFYGTKHVLPLGNFPHPNVFAAFLSFINLLYLSNFKGNKNLHLSYFLLIINVLSCALLGSITSVIFHLLVALVILLHSKSLKIVAFALVPIFLLIITYQSSFKNISVTSRVDQYHTSLFLLKTNPITGAGVGNYVPSIMLYENFLGRTFELQPVHNIFILYLVEFGTVGFIFLIFLVYKNKKYLKLTPFLFYIFIFGVFDHFLFTLNQGLLLLTLTIYLHKSIIDIDAK